MFFINELTYGNTVLSIEKFVKGEFKIVSI